MTFKSSFFILPRLVASFAVLLGIVAFFIFSFSEARAATLVHFDLENPAINEGDTFLVNLKISTSDKLINVVDGTILYDNNKLEIKEVSTGNSLFALWPKSPAFSNNKGTLSFVGGAPSGFHGEKGEVFKIIFLAKSEGEAKIDFLDGFSVFLHDGKGTQINPRLRTLSLNISKRPAEITPKDEWQALVENDKTPPEPFKIYLGQDGSVFDGKKFLSFSATDKQSGIAYYEVTEGALPPQRSNDTYILQEQNKPVKVTIIAYDSAGNARESIYSPTPYNIYYLIITTIIIIILILFFVIYKIYKKRRRFPKNTSA